MNCGPQTTCNNMHKKLMIINPWAALSKGTTAIFSTLPRLNLKIQTSCFLPMQRASNLENVLYLEVMEKSVRQVVSPAYASWPDRRHAGNEVDRRRPMEPTRPLWHLTDSCRICMGPRQAEPRGMGEASVLDWSLCAISAETELSLQDKPT